MKIRISSILILCVAGVAGLILFQTSQNVQRTERELHNVRESLAKELETVRVLETEWDYLNRPDRIEELAQQHLNMQRPDLESLVSNSRRVPVPGAMAIPSRKPVLVAHPATTVEKAGGEDLPSAGTQTKQTLPMPAPVTNDSRQQFDDLLNRLTTHEPAAGGAP